MTQQTNNITFDINIDEALRLPSSIVSSTGTEVGTDLICNTTQMRSGPVRTAKKPKEKRRDYIIVINNPSEEEEKALVNDNYRYLVYQIEKGGNSGTEHLQGYIYYENAVVFPKKRGWAARAHIEAAKKGIAANRKYCTKEETRVRGPFEYGATPAQGNRTDLNEIAERIIDGSVNIHNIEHEYPAEYIQYTRGLQALMRKVAKHRTQAPEVFWLWGLSDAGKSSYAIKKHGRENCYIKDSTRWWDGYEGQEVIIIDDFDGSWPFRNLLRLLDTYDYQGEIKGEFVKITSPYIYITCEFRPEHFWGGGIDGAVVENNTLNQILKRLKKIIHVIRPNHTIRKPDDEEYINLD